MNQPSETHWASDKNILFLDGECIFCQKSARIIHSLDKRGLIYFAPLQGETAKHLPDNWRFADSLNRKEFDAVILSEHTGNNAHLWKGADAVLRTLKLLGGLWAICWLLYYLPSWLKNSAYRLIAQNRHHLAKKNATCPIPDKDMKNSMLP